MGGLEVLRFLGFIWVFAVALGAVYLFPPRDIWGYATLLTFAITPVVALIITSRRVAFAVTVDNVYMVAGYLALSFIVFEFCVVALLFRLLLPYLSDLVYIIAVFSALVLIGVLNEDIPVYQLAVFEDGDSVLAVTRGLAVGSMLYLLVSAIIGALGLNYSMDLAVGYLDSRLLSLVSQFEGVVGVFLLMVFFVAIPEELLSRVFYLNIGSSVVTAPVASVVMITTWYSLHAVTRYFLPYYGSLVLFIITVGGLVITLSYMLYGFVSAVFTHAIYNTLIVLSGDFGSAVLVVAVMLILINFLVARAKGVRAL
jgi:hypothetical protein